MRRIPSRKGAQQGDPLGAVLFCVAILPALRAFRVRTAGCDGTRGEVDDIVTAPAAIILVTMADFSSFRAGLADAGIELSRV